MYDVDGNLVEISFIFFKDLESEEGRKEEWDKLKGLLKEHFISYGTFLKTLSKLTRYCDIQDDLYSLVGAGCTAEGLVWAFVPGVGLFVATGFGIVALVTFFEGNRYDSYRDILTDFFNYILFDSGDPLWQDNGGF
jgi:hypothetical protein